VGEPAGQELPLIRSDVFARYASGGKYVNGITSYDGEERYLEIPNIVVPEDGVYKLVVTYANGESAGTHAYNNDVVERYAQISVNGEEPFTVHFKNTISWLHYATQTIDVHLKAGANTIRFSNNNTYNGGSNPYGGNNASGTAGFTHYTAVPNQYTPAFDRFDLYPQVMVDSDGPTSPAVLTGPETVEKGQTFHVTYGLRGIGQPVYAQDITFEYDKDLLEMLGEPVSLMNNKFVILGYKEDQPGRVRVIAIHLDDWQTNPDQDLMKLPFKALETEGTTKVRITNLTVADKDGTETSVAGAEHTILIRKPTIPGDFNDDDRVSVGDLAMMASAYGKSKNSPDWDQYSHFDLNGDDIIDITDLVMMAQLILSN
jgi:hypothetical protein